MISYLDNDVISFLLQDLMPRDDGVEGGRGFCGGGGGVVAVVGGILWSEEVGVVQPPPSSSLLVLDRILMAGGKFKKGRSCIKSRSILFFI